MASSKKVAAGGAAGGGGGGEVFLDPNAGKKKRWNLFQPLVDRFRKKKYENEMRMLRKEEIMRVDLERFLMEIEEQHSWASFELNYRNLQRLKKEAAIDKVKKREEQKVCADNCHFRILLSTFV
jgi:hypothetical protein